MTSVRPTLCNTVKLKHKTFIFKRFKRRVEERKLLQTRQQWLQRGTREHTLDYVLQVVVRPCQGGVQDSKLLTLTCAEKLSFSFDSCFSLKQNKKKNQKDKTGLLYILTAWGGYKPLGQFQSPERLFLRHQEEPRESMGQRFEANFQSCLSLLLNSDQQRKKKTKHLFFFLASFCLLCSFSLLYGVSRCRKILL